MQHHAFPCQCLVSPPGILCNRFGSRLSSGLGVRVYIACVLLLERCCLHILFPSGSHGESGLVRYVHRCSGTGIFLPPCHLCSLSFSSSSIACVLLLECCCLHILFPSGSHGESGLVRYVHRCSGTGIFLPPCHLCSLSFSSSSPPSSLLPLHFSAGCSRAGRSAVLQLTSDPRGPGRQRLLAPLSASSRHAFPRCVRCMRGRGGGQ